LNENFFNFLEHCSICFFDAPAFGAGALLGPVPLFFLDTLFAAIAKALFLVSTSPAELRKQIFVGKRTSVLGTIYSKQSREQMENSSAVGDTVHQPCPPIFIPLLPSPKKIQAKHVWKKKPVGACNTNLCVYNEKESIHGICTSVSVKLHTSFLDPALIDVVGQSRSPISMADPWLPFAVDPSFFASIARWMTRYCIKC
jgi:hypothetical protein